MRCYSWIPFASLLCREASCYSAIPTFKGPAVSPKNGQNPTFRRWDAPFESQKQTGSAWNPLSLGLALGLCFAVLAGSPGAAAASGWNHGDIPAWTKQYPTCAADSQSPINIQTRNVDSSLAEGTLKDAVKYMAVDGREIVHNGHVMQVNGDFGNFGLPDGTYEVKQFHFHFPAEHEIDGKLGAGELHIVHQRKGATGTDGLAVLGIILEERSGDSVKDKPEIKFLSELGFGKELPQDGEKKTVDSKVDLNAFASEIASGFYHYNGSLTTPPCAENVHWYVAKQAAPVTRQMIDTFKARFPEPGDNRPVQPVNGRQIVLNNVRVKKEFEALVVPETAKSKALDISALKAKLAARLVQEEREIDEEAAAKKKVIDEEATTKKNLAARVYALKLQQAEERAVKLEQAKDASQKQADVANKLKNEAAAAAAASEKLEQVLAELKREAEEA